MGEPTIHRSLCTGKSGTTKTDETTNPSLLSSIAGTALTALGAFSSNPQMMAAGLGSLSGGGGSSPYGGMSPQQGATGYGGQPAQNPWSWSGQLGNFRSSLGFG